MAAHRGVSSDITLQVSDRNSQIIVDSSAAPRTVRIPTGLSSALSAGAYYKIAAPFGSSNPVSFVFDDPTEFVNRKTPPAIAALDSDGQGFWLIANGSRQWATCGRSAGDAGIAQGALFRAVLTAQQVVPPAGSSAVLFDTVQNTNPAYSYAPGTGILTFNIAGKYLIRAGVVTSTSVLITSGTARVFVSSGGAPAVPYSPPATNPVTGLGLLAQDPEDTYTAAAGDTAFINYTNGGGAAPITLFEQSGMFALKVG